MPTFSTRGFCGEEHLGSGAEDRGAWRGGELVAAIHHGAIDTRSENPLPLNGGVMGGLLANLKSFLVGGPSVGCATRIMNLPRKGVLS